jgi:hypothetical protein
MSVYMTVARTRSNSACSTRRIHERCDIRDQIVEGVDMVLARQLDQSRARCASRDVPTLFHHLETIVRPVQHQRRNLDGRQDVPDIGLLDRAVSRDGITGARGQPEESPERPHETLVARQRGRQRLEELTDERRLPPLTFNARIPVLEILMAPERLVVRRSSSADEGTVDDDP